MAPSTVAGLLAQLDAQSDDLAAYAVQLRRIADRFKLTPAGRRNGRPTARWTSSRHQLASTLAGELADIAQQLPRLAIGLRAATVPEPAPSAYPLLLPHPTVPDVWVEAGTGSQIPGGEGPRAVWWPYLAPASVMAGVATYQDAAAADLIFDARRVCPPGLTMTSYTGDLYGWCEATAQLRGRLAAWRGILSRTRGGGSRNRRDERARRLRITRAYASWVAWLTPFGDLLAAQLTTHIANLTAALAAVLADEGITMPTLTGTTAVISDLAQRIRDAITAGHGGRLVVNESEVAMAWAPGLPTSLLTYLAPEWVEGRKTTVTTARDSATPVVPVPEGGQKPDAVAFDSQEVSLKKYPGTALITTESAMFVRGIEPAVANVIGAQIIRAIEADAVTVMQAGAGITVTGAADITDGVLSAIAQLRAAGAAPNAVALSVNDWVSVMKATGAGGYLNFSNPEQGPAGTWLGLAPCIVSTLTDGNAVVVDGRSAPVGEPKGQPLCLVDPFSSSGTNKIKITIESFAIPMVTSPGGVATVTVGP